MKVSIITPTTKSRAQHLNRLLTIIDKQDYPHIEHIVIYDEDKTIGAKRNLACSLAKGEVIIMMDDDDWYSRDFISQSVKHLLSSKSDVTGLSQAYFYQEDPEMAWFYNYTGQQPYVIGSGMCFYRSAWERNNFQDVNEGEDRLFLANAGTVVPHNYSTGFLAFIHGKNTASHKALKDMKAISPDYVRKNINFTR